ncbi:hypothetical protein AAG906_019768 [Vitis piasezkii]
MKLYNNKILFYGEIAMMISFPIYLPWTFKSWKIATILCLAICGTMYMGDWFIIVALHQGPQSTLARLDIFLILFHNMCASKIKDRLFAKVPALIVLSSSSSMSSSRSVSPFMSRSQSTSGNVAILPVQNKYLP